MRPFPALTACLLAASVAAGCDSDRADAQYAEKAPGQLLDGYEQSVSGDLIDVDLGLRALTLVSNDRTQTFRLTEATEVIGARGPQGLLELEGSMATVHYRDEQGSSVALRVVLR